MAAILGGRRAAERTVQWRGQGAQAGSRFVHLFEFADGAAYTPVTGPLQR
jgi:hypothetical protein